VAGAGFRAAVLNLQKVIILDGSHSICGEHPQKFCHELGLDFVSRATDLREILLKYRQYEKYLQTHR
jgi:hypothetical protein